MASTNHLVCTTCLSCLVCKSG